MKLASPMNRQNGENFYFLINLDHVYTRLTTCNLTRVKHIGKKKQSESKIKTAKHT
jgi:hypothetical protein